MEISLRKIYCFTSPVALLIVFVGCPSIRESQKKSALESQITAAGIEIDSSLKRLDKLVETCTKPLQASVQGKSTHLETPSEDLSDRCAPVIPAAVAYRDKIHKMLGLLDEALRLSFSTDEHHRLEVGRRVWAIRDRENIELQENVQCLMNPTSECWKHIDASFANLAKEDQEACNLLSTIQKKCD